MKPSTQVFLAALLLLTAIYTQIAPSTSSSPVQATIMQQVVHNGDFENGLSGWLNVGDPSQGYAAPTDNVVHSGIRALVLTEFPPTPGTNQLVDVIVGVSQTVTVQDLSDLVVSAWYLTQINSYLARPELVVTVGGLSLGYGFGGCIGWCQGVANAADDIRAQYGQDKWNSLIQNGPVKIVISLEIIGHPGILDNQFVYWDDVQADATLPTQSITIVRATTSTSSITTQRAISNQMPSTTIGTTSIAQQSTTSNNQMTESEVLYAGLTATQAYLLLGAIFILGLIVIIALFVKAERKPSR